MNTSYKLDTMIKVDDYTSTYNTVSGPARAV